MMKSYLTAILLGGFVAGTIDIGAAALINLVNPIRVLHFIAGGLLGKAALAGGTGLALLGLLLQWAMSLIIAAIYVFAAHWLGIMRRLWVLSGLSYGIVVFFVMNYIVVPLSAWAIWPHFTVPMFADYLNRVSGGSAT